MPNDSRPFASAAEQNKHVILEVLTTQLGVCHDLLEIGSGTGQHAVHMAPRLSHLRWQPSEIETNLSALKCWCNNYPASNLLDPILLDVYAEWPQRQYDAVYTCNTLHILSIKQIDCMFAGVGQVLLPGGFLCCYGPFNIGGAYTSESNQTFDQYLRRQDPHSGLRNKEDLDALAQSAGLVFHRLYEMPANNHILVWQSLNHPARDAKTV